MRSLGRINKLHLKPYPEYKNTHLSWIDVIPKHWSILRAKHVFKSIDIRSTTGQEELLSVSEKKGVTPRKNLNVTMFQAESYIGYKLCWPGDLVINSLWAWMQGLGFSKYHGIISSAYGVYRLKKELADDYRFFDYLIRSKAYLWELRVKSKGIWRSRYQLTDDSFFSIPIIIPPGEERKRIVRFLDFKSAQISRLIRAKRRIIELFKEQKQAIINQVVTRGLDPNVKLKPSGVEWLGEIPEHWYMKRLKFVSKINNGQVDPKSEHYRNYILIAPNHIESATGKILYYQTASEQGAISGKYFVKFGQIIYSKIRPNLKKVCIAKQDCLCSADMYPITVNDKEILPEYFLLLLLSNPFTKYVIDCSMRVAMPKVNRNSLENCWLWYPSIEEQYNLLDILEKKIKPYDKAIERAKREIALMQEYRARLIADVVTGKVDVRDIEVPDVADEELIIEDRDEMEDAEESVEEAEDEE